MKRLIAAALGVLALAAISAPRNAEAGWWGCHCFHRPVHHFVRHYHPYPNVFISGPVYVPPYYYYEPYTDVDHVLVHRSREIGPVVPAAEAPAPKPIITVLGVTVL